MADPAPATGGDYSQIRSPRKPDLQGPIPRGADHPGPDYKEPGHTGGTVRFGSILSHPLMGLFRTLLVLGAVWLVLRLFSRARGAPEKDRGPALPDMVRCEHCGLYLAAHEATRAGGRYFCSPEHAEAGRTL
jgi:hypothetical protein